MALTFDPCKPLKTRGGGRGSELTHCGPMPAWMGLNLRHRTEAWNTLTEEPEPPDWRCTLTKLFTWLLKAFSGPMVRIATGTCQL
jgi:hypothetical protein